MTRAQLSCQHVWRQAGHCSECWLTRKALKAWIDEILPPDPQPEDIKPENLKLKFDHELPPLPTLTEQMMGLPDSYKGYQPEAYLVGEPRYKMNGQ